MDQHKQASGSSFLNGLLLGIVIGAGIAVLLTTKKGKRMLKAFTEEGIDSINNLDDIYNRLEKILKEDGEPEVPATIPERKLIAEAPALVPVPVVQAEVPPTPLMTQPDSVQPSVTAPVLEQAVPEPAVSMPLQQPQSPPQVTAPSEEVVEEHPKKTLIIAVDAQTSSKFAEVQQRLDQEIEDVSEAIAQKFVAYADDDTTDLDAEDSPMKVKPTRRRFFRGIQRRA